MVQIRRPEQNISCHNLIGGEWLVGSAGKVAVDSPYFGENIGEVSLPSLAEIDSAIKNAAEAQKLWGEIPIKERSQVLFDFRHILFREIDKIAQMVSLENGKTPEEAKAGIFKGIEVLEFALSLQNSDHGGRMQVSRGVFCEYRRRPLGVVVGITPFNFPFMVPMWTIPIAIVLGNSYVWKPSDKTPLTSMLLANAFLEAGLPKGVLSVLQGGAETVESIVDHPLVKSVGFVGSSAIAKKVFQKTTARGKRCLALGGAKNHMVLLPDADPQLAAKGISDSFTGCGGQRCMAASVLLAVGQVDEMIDQIKSHASSIQVGKDMGSIISRQQLEFLNAAIEKAEQEGAKIILDGRKSKSPQLYPNGYWLGPTIIDQVRPGTQAAQDELFGPILSIIRVDSISRAMQIENSSSYGNACSVFTRSGPLAERVIEQAGVGMMGVNIGVPVPREPFSFGGINESKFGQGEITGSGSLALWSDQVKITTKWETQTDANWMS